MSEQGGGKVSLAGRCGGSEKCDRGVGRVMSGKLTVVLAEMGRKLTKMRSFLFVLFVEWILGIRRSQVRSEVPQQE